MTYRWALLTKAKSAVTVHDPFGQVDVPILPSSIEVLKSCAEDWLSISLHAEADVLSSLGKVCVGMVSSCHLVPIVTVYGAVLTLATPLEVSIVIANAAVEVDLGIDVLSVLTLNAAAQPAAIVDVDARDLGGVVEVGHFEWSM